MEEEFWKAIDELEGRGVRGDGVRTAACQCVVEVLWPIKVSYKDVFSDRLPVELRAPLSRNPGLAALGRGQGNFCPKARQSIPYGEKRRCRLLAISPPSRRPFSTAIGAAEEDGGSCSICMSRHVTRAPSLRTRGVPRARTIKACSRAGGACNARRAVGRGAA